MQKILSLTHFIPYTLSIDNEKDHLLLLKVIDVAIDTYTVRGLDTDDFEFLKDVIKGVPK